MTQGLWIDASRDLRVYELEDRLSKEVCFNLNANLVLGSCVQGRLWFGVFGQGWLGRSLGF